MSNFNLKAKNKQTGEIVDFHAMDNYFGHHIYGYEENNNTFKSNPIKNRVLKESEFDELYEVVENNSGEKIYENTLVYIDDNGILKKTPISTEDPNHPYGGMETWREAFDRENKLQKELGYRGFDRNEEHYIKQFIKIELERICGEVEKLKYSQPMLGTPESTERVMNAVNNTIDDIINIIKK